MRFGLDSLSPQVHGRAGFGRIISTQSRTDPRRRPRPCCRTCGPGRRGRSLSPRCRGRRRPEHVSRSPTTPASTTSAPRCLLEALIERPVARLIVASSMSIYGEGLYQDPDGNISNGLERTCGAAPRAHEWEVRNNRQQVLTPVPTPETKPPTLASVYALSKYDQERLCLMIGRAYAIPTVALRFFNVYGPRQALSNPYTGVLAIFASRLMNDRPPVIFEDGLSATGFCQRSRCARERAGWRWKFLTPPVGVFNIGSGRVLARSWRLPTRWRRSWARDTSSRKSRQVSRRRHPPLFCRHPLGPSPAGLRAASRRWKRGWWSWRSGSRDRSRRTASAQMQAELDRRGPGDLR